MAATRVAIRLDSPRACSQSVPFQKNVKPEKLFTPEYSAGAMLDVLDGLQEADTGGFFAFDGSKIEF